jgi:fructosamine-3-kinase
VKQNDASFLDNFQAESEGLRSLSDLAQSVDGLEVPLPLFVDEVDGDACLVLKWIESSKERVRDFQYGQAIAKMHAAGIDQGGSIGYERDNYLGASRQINSLPSNTPAKAINTSAKAIDTPAEAGGNQAWIDFVAENRLGAQIRMARDRNVASNSLVQRVDAVIADLSRLLQGRRDTVTLIHGDLWSGNVLFDIAGNVVLIDPAVYRGCGEAEFGMLKLYGGVGAAFDEGYQSVLDLPDGWQRRTDVYVLYHLLNHLNLFGGGYLNQCEQLAAKLGRY